MPQQIPEEILRSLAGTSTRIPGNPPSDGTSFMETLSQALQQLKGQLRGGDAFQLLTGMLPQDISPAGRTSAIPTDPFLTNAPSHAASTEAIARRFDSPTFANIIGALQEIPSGLGNLQEGKSFFTGAGESGFSLPDIIANAAGASRGRIPDPLSAAILVGTAGFGSEGASKELASQVLRDRLRAMQGFFGLE